MSKCGIGRRLLCFRELKGSDEKFGRHASFWKTPMTPYGNIRLVIFAQLRAKPVFDLVKGIVDLMASRLDEASQLKVGTPEVFTPFAEGCFTTEHVWSRQ